MQVFIERKINICIIISFDILMWRFCIYCMMYVILCNSWINMEACFSNRKTSVLLCSPVWFFSWKELLCKSCVHISNSCESENILDLHRSSNTWWSQFICVCQGINWPGLTLLFLCPKNSQPKCKMTQL